MMGNVLSAIAGLILFGTLAALSMYNAVRCDSSIRAFRKRGHTQNAEIVSFTKRREKTSASGRYTTVTRYEITVRIELTPENIITRTISTASFGARKYRRKSHAEVVFLQRDQNPIHIEDLKIKEDLKSTPEFFLSVVLFIIFSVFFIMNIVGMFA